MSQSEIRLRSLQSAGQHPLPSRAGACRAPDPRASTSEGRYTDVPWLRRGFTLIEMLVVMAVIALLLSIAVPRYFGSLDKSKEVALKENLQVMRTAIDRFYTDKGRFPNDLGELVSEKYFRAVPVDPVTESATTWVLVPSRDIEKPGIEDVKSGAPGTTRDKIPYSQL